MESHALNSIAPLMNLLPLGPNYPLMVKVRSLSQTKQENIHGSWWANKFSGGNPVLNARDQNITRGLG